MIQLEVSVSFKPGAEIRDSPDNEWIAAVEEGHEIVGSERNPLLLIPEIRSHGLSVEHDASSDSLLSADS